MNTNYTECVKLCPVFVNQTNVPRSKVEATKPISFVMQPEFKARTLEGIGFLNLFNFMTCVLCFQCCLDLKSAGFDIMHSFT